MTHGGRLCCCARWRLELTRQIMIRHKKSSRVLERAARGVDGRTWGLWGRAAVAKREAVQSNHVHESNGRIGNAYISLFVYL